jgi:osmoprotectant transport system permease protein
MNFFHFIWQNHAQVLELTLEHLWLVGWSTLFAVVIGIPLGVAIARHPASSKPVLASANIIQTIPSLALFGFLLPVPWLGDRAERLAILALTLYALLPVIRNTYTGICGVDPAVVEAGRGERDSVRGAGCDRDLSGTRHHCGLHRGRWSG